MALNLLTSYYKGQQYDLTVSARLLLAYLCFRAGGEFQEENEERRKYDTIIRETQLKRRVFFTALKELRDKGFIYPIVNGSIFVNPEALTGKDCSEAWFWLLTAVVSNAPSAPQDALSAQVNALSAQVNALSAPRDSRQLNNAVENTTKIEGTTNISRRIQDVLKTAPVTQKTPSAVPSGPVTDKDIDLFNDWAKYGDTLQ